MKRLAAIFITMSVILVLAGCETSVSSDTSLTDKFSETISKSDNVNSSEASVTSVAETISVTAAENEGKPIDFEDNKYQLIGVDFSSMPAPEDYELFRKYFFGVWDSPDRYLPSSLTIDDSENINFAGRGYYNAFYQPSDSVIAFTLHTNGDAHVLWLDMANPDVMYTAAFLMRNGLGVFTLEGITSDVHALTKNDAAPSEPTDGFLSIFKLHEMARDYGMDFDLLTNIDFGFIDGKYFLHSATYDFYPMYLVSKTDDKIVIRTSVGNIGSIDLKPIDVVCTFERVAGEWNRNVELF